MDKLARTGRMIVLLLGLVTVACGGSAVTPAPALSPTPVHTSTGIPAGQKENGALRELTILYTGDEHGWMEATDESGGAAGMVGLWRQQEGYHPDGPFLILSGGDMWTGPAISTWFDGESMAEVMNAMGYDAAVVGNHEFDFGLQGLAVRAAQSEFPFLAANVTQQQSGAPAESLLPYVIQQVNNIRVGIIGLASLDTPETTRPAHVAELAFGSYRQTLQEVVPRLRAEGAELLLVIGHLCPQEMEALAPLAAELNIAMIGGGHCHQRVSRLENGVALAAAGAHLEAYVKVTLLFDTASDRVTELQVSSHDNRGGEPDAAIAALVADWRAQVDAALQHPIGYAAHTIDQHSAAMYNLVTDAWLAAYPAADIAMTNRGGFRQSIPAGEITLEDVVGVMPFDNLLIDVELSGAQIIENITCCNPVVAGMTTGGNYRLANGQPLQRDQTYRVLVNDFIYAGGSGFKFQQQNPAGYDTSIDWRQPVIEWISAQQTSPDNPLEAYLDTESR